MRAVRCPVLGLGVAVISMSGCARSPQTDTPLPSVTSLSVARIVPDSARIADGEIVVVRIVGSGFAAEGNVIEFGPVTLTGIRASAGGDTLTFTVPLEVPSRGGAPPRRLDPGEYSVVVRIGDARSAAVRFRVTDAPGVRLP